jgi:hypothetical protein
MKTKKERGDTNIHYEYSELVNIYSKYLELEWWSIDDNFHSKMVGNFLCMLDIFTVNFMSLIEI